MPATSPTTPAATPRHRPRPPIVADRGEFIDALRLLHRGHVMVNVGDSAHGWGIDGAIVRHSATALRRYDLVEEFDNPEGFPGVRYFRRTARGRGFAEQALAEWRSRPWWARALARLVG